MENNTRQQVMQLIGEKLVRFSIRETELINSFDLVKTGLLNSLEFVDLVASLEKLYDVEIDFEQALAKGDFTTLGGLINAFDRH